MPQASGWRSLGIVGAREEMEKLALVSAEGMERGATAVEEFVLPPNSKYGIIVHPALDYYLVL